MNGQGLNGALKTAQAEGRTDLDGKPLDMAGKLAILAAAQKGETDPAKLRAASRKAKA